MKKQALVVGCLLGVALAHGQTGSYQVERTFVSPGGSGTAAVAAQASALGRGHPPIYSLGAVSNGSFVPFRDLPPSKYFRDGSAFAVLTWNRGAVEAVRYDANLNETGRTAVNFHVDRESALSLSLNTNLAQAAKSILSDPTIFH